MNPLFFVPVCASGFVTMTLTVPAACKGVLQVIEVALTKVTAVAGVVSNVTAKPAPETNPVPVIVTSVPPAVGPDEGETVVIVGGGGVEV